MFKVALKSLLGHKLRMLLTGFSIIIGVSFVAGSYIFTDSMSKTFSGIFEDALGSVDVIVRPKQAEDGFGSFGLKMPASVIDDVRKVKGVDQAEGEIAGLAQLIDANGEPIGGNGPPTLGFSWNEVDDLNVLKIKDGNGRAPESIGEIVIDINTAETNNLNVGDKVRVQAFGPAEEFTIVGLVSFGESNTLAGATLSAFTFDQASVLFGYKDEFAQISITAKSGIDAEELKNAVASALPSGVEAVTGQQQSNEQLEDLDANLGIVTTALLAFAAVSIFVGSFIIQNTFRIIVAQRSKELALLRAVGASRFQVVRMVLYEAVITSIVASILGILAGVGVSSLLRAVANSIGLGLPPGELSLEPRTIIVSMGVGVVVTLTSALVPAVKASRIPPVEAMRDMEMSRPKESLRSRALVGLIVCAIGIGLMTLGLFGSIKNPVYLVGGGAAILFIGVNIIAPIMTGIVARVVSAPILLVFFWFGIVGKIGRQNTVRSPRRTASTAAALMIGVSLVVFASIFASSLRETIDDIVGDSFPGDIIIMPKNNQGDPAIVSIPSQIGSDVAALNEVELVSSAKYDYLQLDGKKTLVAAIEPGTFNEIAKLEPIDGSYDVLAMDTIYVNKDVLTESSRSIGDTIDVSYPNGETGSLKISGSFSEPFDTPYLISFETHASHFPPKGNIYTVANVASGVSFEDAKIAIAKVTEKYPTAKVQDKTEFIGEVRTQIDQVLGLMTALLAFAIIIAVLGITNTLTLSVTERTREIGMLRAVGMSRRQVRRMVRMESVIIAVFGALLGVILGIFFAWAILRSLEDQGFKAFSIPLIQVGIYLVLAALAGVVAAIGPSFKASRMNILKAINYE